MQVRHPVRVGASTAGDENLCKPFIASRAGSYRANTGFTLVEVLVAISVMALMTLMAWRGLDGMLHSQRELQSRADQVRTLQAGLAQWQTDLAQTTELNGTPAWHWDGKVLRLTRQAPAFAEAGVQVVAWTWRQDTGRPGGGDWVRWQSPSLRTQGAWQLAWQDAQTWSQSPTAALRQNEVQIHPLSGWQLYVHRGGNWTNPLSDASASSSANGAASNSGTGTTTSYNTVPDGVRLLLDLPAATPLPGRISLDWVRPQLSGSGT